MAMKEMFRNLYFLPDKLEWFTLKTWASEEERQAIISSAISTSLNGQNIFNLAKCFSYFTF